VSCGPDVVGSEQQVCVVFSEPALQSAASCVVKIVKVIESEGCGEVWGSTIIYTLRSESRMLAYEVLYEGTLGESLEKPLSLERLPRKVLQCRLPRFSLPRKLPRIALQAVLLISLLKSLLKSLLYTSKLPMPILITGIHGARTDSCEERAERAESSTIHRVGPVPIPLPPILN
jgi:hypothetical protein